MATIEIKQKKSNGNYESLYPKTISTAVTTAEDKTLEQALTEKAPLASPIFTGEPKAPTPPASDNSTRIATTAFVKNVASQSGGGIRVVPWSELDNIKPDTAEIVCAQIPNDTRYINRLVFCEAQESDQDTGDFVMVYYQYYFNNGSIVYRRTVYDYENDRLIWYWSNWISK